MLIGPARRSQGSPLQRNGPFPLEELAIRVRHTILEEFEGRRPSILEVDSLPDNHWLQLPSIGPKVLASMRELARGASRKAGRSSLAGMTDAELNAECDHLDDQRKAIDAQLKVIKAELRSRSEAKRYAAATGAF